MKKPPLYESRERFITSVRTAADAATKMAEHLYTLAGDASAMTEQEFEASIPAFIGRIALAMREME